MSTGAIVVLSIASLICFIGWIILVVAAFRQHVLWGLGVLLLWPVTFVFGIVHWREAKAGFLTYVVGFVAAGLVYGVFLKDAMDEAVALAAEESRQAAAGLDEKEGGFAQPATKALQTAAPTAPAAVAGSGAAAQGNRDRGDGAPRLVRYSYREVSLADIEGKVRERVQITTRNGQRHTGDLIEANSRRVELRKRMQGGTFDFGIDAGDIKRIKLWALDEG